MYALRIGLKVRYVVLLNMNYDCPRCGYHTTKRSNFLSHLQRKKPCEPLHNDVDLQTILTEYTTEIDKTYMCNCGKSYATRSGLQYHSKICNSQVIQLQHTVNAMQKCIQELQSQRSTPVIIQNIQNIDNSQHVHFHLNNFGNENINHLTSDFKLECFRAGALGVLQWMKQVWFNESHPENFNIRLLSLKNMLVQVFQDPEWVARGFNEIIDQMIQMSSSDIILSSEPLKQGPRNDVVYNMNAIQNISPGIKKKIKEFTKSSLVNRRQSQKTIQ